MSDLLTLAADLVRIDSRSFVSNLAVAERIESELTGFEVERLDYVDPAGIAKRALVAHRGPAGGLALSGHMDTVPATGWDTDPWSGHTADGNLHGLGSTDMKGPVAACIFAARELPAHVPITLLFTTDEETSKQGARLIATNSALVRQVKPRAILIAEPTSLIPVRGHRSAIGFVVTATGIQAHSSTGKGRNANWALAPFVLDMRAIYERLRDDPTLHDQGYDPPFSDFNIVIDNFGAPVNMTVPKAEARIKFRYSASIDPAPILAAVREAAARHGLDLAIAAEGPPALVFDIGGGSTELMLVAPGSVNGGEPEIIDWVSLPWGVVSLAETEPQWPDAADRLRGYERMLQSVGPMLDAFGQRLAARGVTQVQMLGTSGTITTLASVELGLPGYDRRRVDGCAVNNAPLLALCRRIALQSVQERARVACIGPDRAELIVAGCAILEAILGRWPGGDVRVADRGIREGILRTLMGRDGVWAAGK